MNDQPHSWSRVAASYEKEFIDPYLPEVRNPVRRVLRQLARRGAATVADLGCGVGPLLPLLAKTYSQVWAVDFAEGMLTRARDTVGAAPNVTFLQRSLTDLEPLHGRLDVAVAVNSLVMPDPRDLDASLRAIRGCLKPGGTFIGILPAMDAVHYLTTLLIDRALERGQPLEAARKNAAHHNDHADYDFAFGQAAFQGLEQHFWQPFEVHYRFVRAGLRLQQLKKVQLAWRQFSAWRDLQNQSPPWDWFFLARPLASEV